MVKDRNLPPVELDDYAMFLLRAGERDEFFEHITLIALHPDTPLKRENPPHLFLLPMHVAWIYAHSDKIPFYREHDRDHQLPIDWEHSWRPRHDPRRPIPSFVDHTQGLYLLIWDNLLYALSVL